MVFVSVSPPLITSVTMYNHISVECQINEQRTSNGSITIHACLFIFFSLISSIVGAELQVHRFWQFRFELFLFLFFARAGAHLMNLGYGVFGCSYQSQKRTNFIVLQIQNFRLQSACTPLILRSYHGLPITCIRRNEHQDFKRNNTTHFYILSAFHQLDACSSSDS